MRVRVNSAGGRDYVTLYHIVSGRRLPIGDEVAFLGASNCRPGGNQIYTGCYSAQDIEAFGDETE